jgi:hypothetical protein
MSNTSLERIWQALLARAGVSPTREGNIIISRADLMHALAGLSRACC